MNNVSNHAKELGYRVVEQRRCRQCQHDPGGDRLCLVAHRHATGVPKLCEQYQPVCVVPDWLK